MNPWPFPPTIKNARVMVFVDGENLAIRYGKLLGGVRPVSHVTYEPNVFVWSELLNMADHVTCEVVRCHYYTTVEGDEPKRRTIHERLQELSVQAPHVFHKPRSTSSKQVDVSLTVDMLNHAHRRNYDAAVLVAGDADYIPLVKSVIDSGRRVFLWFVSSGLSPDLRRSVDHFYDLDKVLLNEHAQPDFGRH